MFNDVWTKHYAWSHTVFTFAKHKQSDQWKTNHACTQNKHANEEQIMLTCKTYGPMPLVLICSQTKTDGPMPLFKICLNTINMLKNKNQWTNAPNANMLSHKDRWPNNPTTNMLTHKEHIRIPNKWTNGLIMLAKRN